MSELLVQLLILLTPGIIAQVIIQILTSHKPITQFYFFVYSSILSIVSYTATYIIFTIVGFLVSNVIRLNIYLLKWAQNHVELALALALVIILFFLLCKYLKIFLSICTIYSLIAYFQPEIILNNTLFEFIESGKYKIQNPWEIICATLFGIIIAICLCKIRNSGLLYDFLQGKLGVTNKFSEPSVFVYFLNHKKISKWISIRDIEKNLCYFGWLMAYSEPDESEQVITLNDVTVYQNDTANELFKCEYMYIPFDHKTMLIESYKSVEEDEEKELDREKIEKSSDQKKIAKGEIHGKKKKK